MIISPPLNIIYYNEYFRDPYGSSQHACGLLKSLQNNSKISTITAFPAFDSQPKYQATTNYNGIGFSIIEQLLRFAKRIIQSYISYSIFLKHWYLKQKTKSTILLARVSPFDFAPLLISKTIGIPIVAEWNAPFFYEIGSLRKGSLISLTKLWERKILQSSSMVYTVSNQLRHLLINEYKLPQRKFFTIPNGFDPDIYPTDERSLQTQYQNIRNKLGWNNYTVIAFVGSLKIWHGVENLLRIAEYFSNRDNSIKFLIIGDGEDRIRIIKAKDRLKNILWLGLLPPAVMAEYLTGCDLGIMPYPPIEKFYFSPLKLYDMIGACLPSIGASIGQINEVYKNHPEVGWGIEKYAPKEYIVLIQHLQFNKEKILKKRKCLIKSRFNHTWNERVDKLINLIYPLSNNFNDIQRKSF